MRYDNPTSVYAPAQNESRLLVRRVSHHGDGVDRRVLQCRPNGLAGRPQGHADARSDARASPCRDSNDHADADPSGHPNADVLADPHPDGNANDYADADPHARADADGHASSDVDADPNAPSGGHVHSDARPDAVERRPAPRLHAVPGAD